jgi:hypothetical protein
MMVSRSSSIPQTETNIRHRSEGEGAKSKPDEEMEATELSISFSSIASICDSSVSNIHCSQNVYIWLVGPKSRL